uniref:Uncharacterized protein n=1 Tax=Lygus hesperus TaxID=30085 RepID=A0A0A9ZFE4_LYGHE
MRIPPTDSVYGFLLASSLLASLFHYTIDCNSPSAVNGSTTYSTPPSLLPPSVQSLYMQIRLCPITLLYLIALRSSTSRPFRSTCCSVMFSSYSTSPTVVVCYTISLPSSSLRPTISTLFIANRILVFCASLFTSLLPSLLPSCFSCTCFHLSSPIHISSYANRLLSVASAAGSYCI